MQFFSEQLISTGYLDWLNQDLERADVCRFLVAYISEDGLRAIDRAALVRAHPNPSNAKMLWTPESFAVAIDEKHAKLQRIDGYYVPPELRTQILIYLTEELMIDRKQAKVWPVAASDLGKEGKRISKHPLHDTFIGPDAELRRDDFYDKTKRGALVAEIDESRGRQLAATQKQLAEPVERVQRVCTMKLESLQSEWTSIANQLKSKEKGPGNKE